MSGGAAWGFFLACATVIGLVVGSFLNVAIARLPEDRSLWPRSRCPRCGAGVRPLDLVPVLSWVLLRARCRACEGPISPAYPLVEVLAGLLAWLAFHRFVPGPEALDLPHLLAWAYWFGFLCLLVVAAYVDLRHHIIPDETSIYAIPLGVLGAALLGVVGYEGWLSISWRATVLGALLAGVFFAGVAVLAHLILRREAFGWGDVKLLAMFGAFLGPAPGSLIAVLLGALLGSLVGIGWTLVHWRRAMLPAGPQFALGAAIYVLYGDWILEVLLPGMVGGFFQTLLGAEGLR